MRVRERLKEENMLVPVVVRKDDFTLAKGATLFPRAVAAYHIVNITLACL